MIIAREIAANNALKTPGDGEIPGDGLAGIRLCKDSFMPVKYHI